MPVLATWVPEDAVLAAVAPLALAVAGGTCLVVDLDPVGPHYPGSGSLADLVARGPRAVDLDPQRRGVAIMRNGGIDEAAAGEVLAALMERWPRVVLRLPATPTRPGRTGVVPVVLGGLPLISHQMLGPHVVQPVWRRPGARRPGAVVLPSVGRSTVVDLVEGRIPGPSRWLRAWNQVWELAWA